MRFNAVLHDFMQRQDCLYMRCSAETQAVDWQRRSLGEMWWQHHVQVSLLIAMSRVCNITLLACFPRCTARNKVPPLSNDFSQAPCASPRLIPPSALYAFKLSRKPIYPQIKVQHRCGAGFQCIGEKNRAITWKERTMGIVLIAGVWVREPSRHEQTPSLSLHWERKRKTCCSMQKKTSFLKSKGPAHPQKRREGRKEREFIFVGGGGALQVHYIMGMESSIPA